MRNLRVLAATVLAATALAAALAGACGNTTTHPVEPNGSAAVPTDSSPIASTPEPTPTPTPTPPTPDPDAPIAAKPVTAYGLSSTPLFECYDVNFAWGAQFRGFVIDDAGRLWTFDRARGHVARDVMWTPKPASDPKRFDGDDLRGKYWSAESKLQVPLASVDKHAALVAAAKAGKLTTKHTAADAGGHGCVAYSWTADKTSYENVELGSQGDTTVTNSAPEAAELVAWLNKIKAAMPAPRKP